MIKEEEKYRVKGYSKDLWIEDYDTDVDTVAIVEETPFRTDKKVLVTLDEIDGERNVCVSIRRSALKEKHMDKDVLLKALMSEESLYDTKRNELYIPDVSGDPSHVYGMQIADLSEMTREDMLDAVKTEGTLTIFALGHFPAPATCAPDRLGFWGFDDPRTDELYDDTADEKEQMYRDFLDCYEERYGLEHLVTEDVFMKSLK